MYRGIYSKFYLNFTENILLFQRESTLNSFKIFTKKLSGAAHTNLRSQRKNSSRKNFNKMMSQMKMCRSEANFNSSDQNGVTNEDAHETNLNPSDFYKN